MTLLWFVSFALVFSGLWLAYFCSFDHKPGTVSKRPAASTKQTNVATQTYAQDNSFPVAAEEHCWDRTSPDSVLADGSMMYNVVRSCTRVVHAGSFIEKPR